MIKSNIIALSAVLALGLQTAAADETSTSTQSQSGALSSSSPIRLSKLMEANVQSKSGENLGQLEDLIIDAKTGDIKFAVLGRGGFLGFGEKFVPVPWKAINVQSEEQFTLNIDKEKLKSAPTTDKEFTKIQDPGYTVTIYRFFAVPMERDMGAAESPEGVQEGAGSNTRDATSNTAEDDDSDEADQQ